MKFNKLLVKIEAEDGLEYGYSINFYSGLNIIRGDNSSGKSTLVNSLIYALGMEEIIGSRGNSSLPYALKEKFVLGQSEVKIISSNVLLEIESKSGKTITLKRSIKSSDVDTKLVQIINGPYLTSEKDEKYEIFYTFLHDGGSAQDKNRGFFAYFESFLGLSLPKIVDSSGKETKLYLQTIFSALTIEQKRGWTDYIANIPYYGVRGLREKVASFIIDLDVFRNSKKLNILNLDKNNLTSDWANLTTKIKLISENKNFSISGLSKTPLTDFDKKLVTFGEHSENGFKAVDEVKSILIEKLRKIEKKENITATENPDELIAKLKSIQNRIDELVLLYEMKSSQCKINTAQLSQYEVNLGNIKNDLKDNKLTLKIVNFGAHEANIKIAQGQCPTCLNPVDDILISPDSISMPMSLEENITHLNNQQKMINVAISLLKKEIDHDSSQLISIDKELVSFRKLLISEKKDLISTSNIKEADIRRKILTENRLSDAVSFEEEFSNALSEFTVFSKEYKSILRDISKLSSNGLSRLDWKKIKQFEIFFKTLASEFGYRSARVDEIQVKPVSLLPYLQDLELRQKNITPSDNEEKSIASTDIKSDSSASDFVRLIWAYLISLYETSVMFDGNHPGLILFDEPAQHSMSAKSVNQMLNVLANKQGLQSIVAASFDENDNVFAESTAGIKNFNVNRLPSKLIERL